MKVDQLFTAESLGSLQGAAAAAWLVPNVLGYLIGARFGKDWRKWSAFAVGLSVAYLVAATTTAGAAKWAIAFLNGLLIFASAVGINEFSSQAKQQAVFRGRTFRTAARGDAERAPFVITWFG